jgi:undecaprenyl-diphosphatase
VISRPVHRLRAIDERLFRTVAQTSTPLDPALPRLSRAADHGVLWLGFAAALAATGRPGRRAAVRGLASLAVASAVVNGPAKWTFRRSRPVLTEVPSLRLLTRQPATTSFPSGHAASAAAFAAGVGMQLPLAAVPIGLVAAAVVYSRVHTGVHYPADVTVGALAGVSSALLVRRAWPMPPAGAGPAEAPPVAAPALADGSGLAVVVNLSAGSAGDDLTELLQRELPGACLVPVEDADDLLDRITSAARGATALGVAGGDGTVNCAAGVALDRGLPLAVIAGGTLNHFAADVGIDDTAAVARAIRAGDAAEVAVGSATEGGDDRYFLNTFSVGVYPELVHRRERRERWLGKWLALAVALAEVLGRGRPLDIEIDGESRRLWLLFGGNGHYEPDGFAPSWRPRLDEGCIDVRLVDAARPWARLRLVAAVLSGRLGRCRVYEERLVDRIRLRLPDGVRLARDGESEPAPTEITLRPAARRLVVYRPAPR